MVSILKAAKNIISGKDPGSEVTLPPDNRIDRIDQAKVIWYQWKNELTTGGNAFGIGSPIPVPTPSSMLAASRSYDISNHIESWAYEKSMGSGAGSFALTLGNSFDWARYMRPGQWLCCFLTGDGDLPLPVEPAQGSANSTSKLGGLVSAIAKGMFSTTSELPLPAGPSSNEVQAIKKKLRCMGIIQRVAIKSVTTPDGTVETSYVVTGKDFGTVLEETELWFNASNADGIAFVSLVNSVSQQFTRNLTDLMSKWFDIFMNPNAVLKSTLSNIKSFFPTQWVLPDQLVKDLGLELTAGGDGTFGEIKGFKEFNATIFENPDPNPLAGLQGFCWDRLKGHSEPGFHELFTELSDEGNPKLIFRPVPWAKDKSNYPTIGNLMLSYKDLTKVTAPALPIGTNVGLFKDIKSLSSAISAAQKTALPKDARVNHSVPLTAAEVENFDLGPDYHNRSNFFLVDAMQNSMAQQNSWALTAKEFSSPWPIRDEGDIKRHGFRPKFLSTNTFTLTNNQLFGVQSSLAFMKELNFLLKDLWADAEDFYSGSMNLSAGKNDVKLGKVIITDKTFEGIAEMVFYIEGYTDSFNVDQDGTGVWNQSLKLTRGLQKTVLDGGSSKDKQATEPETFHVNRGSNDGNGGILSTVKKGIKDPKSFF